MQDFDDILAELERDMGRHERLMAFQASSFGMLYNTFATDHERALHSLLNDLFLLPSIDAYAFLYIGKFMTIRARLDGLLLRKVDCLIAVQVEKLSHLERMQYQE